MIFYVMASGGINHSYIKKEFVAQRLAHPPVTPKVGGSILGKEY